MRQADEAARPMHPLRLRLFGSAAVEGPSGPITGRAVQRRRIGLLALLAVARERGLSRDRITGYLWPDADPEHARRLLSDSVYRINQLCDGDALIAAGTDLRLNLERLSCDVCEFTDAVQNHDWERAVELYAAPFMDGFYLTDSREMEGWVDAQRERLARERARALEALATAADRDDDASAAVRWWRMLADQNPWSGRIALSLMRALDRAGDRAAALHHARAHTEVLEAEIGVAPDSALLEYAAQLRSGAPRRPPRDGSPTTAALPRATFDSTPGHDARRESGRETTSSNTVAVLPFIELGGPDARPYFADGITEDVISQLSKVAALRVTSRASVMQFRGRTPSLEEIGSTLNVGTVLTGSIRSAGERVRIVVQLAQVSTGECLWAATYDRWLTDVFAIQSDLALRIADALQAELTPDERSRIHREPTRDLRAYQNYLQGRYCFLRFTPDGLRQAIGFFERALELDPDYALAWTGIALASAELVSSGIEPDAEHRRARDAVARALLLDPDLAEAHCMLGHIRATCDFDWPGAEAAFQRALELNPSSADTYDFYGRMCSGLGRYDAALALLQRAQELDPMAHRADYAGTLLRAGRFQEALAAARLAVAFDPQYHRSRAVLGWALLKTGHVDEGLAELRTAVRLSPDVTMWLAQLGQALAMNDRRAEAIDVLRQLQALASVGYVSPYHLAYVYTGLGEHDRALDLLEEALDKRAGAVYGLRGSFLFEPLHDHPRFRQLLARLHS